MRTLLLLALLGLPACSGGTPAAEAESNAAEPAPVHTKTVLSDVYHVDTIYKSMRGPWSQKQVYLDDPSKPELLWITGYQTRIVDAKTDKRIGPDFMCHANLDFDVDQYYSDFKTDHGLSGRVFTLSQGQQHIEFPSAWGIPFLSTEPLELTTQVLNLNIPDPNMDVQHQVTIEYVKDSELTSPMKPLFQGAVEGFKSLEGEGLVYGVSDPSMEKHGAGCAVGASAIKGDVDYDTFGRKFTAHWVVQPGREVTRTDVTKFLNLQFDTKVHYIAVHLHPYAESLTLIDKTTGKTVYKADVVNDKDKVGLAKVPFYSSDEGTPVYEDHEYELVSVYNNTTDEPVDSMAVMYLYMEDPSWEKPDMSQIAPVTPDESKAHAAGNPSAGKAADAPGM